MTIETAPRAYVTRPHLEADLREYIKGPWERFECDVGEMARMHRFMQEKRTTLDTAGPVFAKLRDGLKPKQWYAGQPIQWRVRCLWFSLLLGNQGKFVVYPKKKGWDPAIANELYAFLTGPKVGLTDDECKALLVDMEYIRVEIASPVTRNGQGVLKKGEMGYVTITIPNDVLPPGEYLVKLDGSEGHLEYETAGTTPDAIDAHSLITRTAVTVGHIHQIHSEQLRQKPLLELISLQVPSLREDLNLAVQDLKREGAKPWQAISTLNRAILRLEGKIDLMQTKAQGPDIKQTLEDGFRDVTSGLKAVVDAVKDASKDANALTEVLLDDTKQEVVKAVDASIELHHTELVNQVDEGNQAVREDVAVLKTLMEKHAEETLEYHKDSVLRDNARAVQVAELQEAVEKYHRVDMYRTKLILRHFNNVEERLPVLEEKVAAVHDALQDMSRKIQRRMRRTYAQVLFLLEEIPGATVRQVAEMLEEPASKVNHWFSQLGKWGLITRQGEVEKVQPKPSGSPGKIKAPARSNGGWVRTLYHFFAKNRGEQPNGSTSGKDRPRSNAPGPPDGTGT